MTVIRCSKLARYMECAGYMHLDVEEPEAGDPAKEGTACGELLTSYITHVPVGLSASNGVYFDDDMRFYMRPLADDILSRANGPITSEQRIDWQTRSGIWVRGQPDASYVDKKDRLCIDDLKYGWGIVEVKENWQLIGYAIGEVIKRQRSFSEIVFRICQPRPHHEDGDRREWIISYADLLAYKEKIENRFMELANGRKDFQTSKQCKYCKGAAEACPAFSRLFYKSIEVSTAFVQDHLTDEEIAKQLDLVKRAEEVLKIKLDSLTELGAMRIKKGAIIPGYVAEANYGDRTWKLGVTPESIKILTNGHEIIERKVMSPAKAEKLGVSKDLISKLTERRFTGMKLKKKDASDIGNKIFGTQNPTGGSNVR